jgi:hypothetical protein
MRANIFLFLIITTTYNILSAQVKNHQDKIDFLTSDSVKYWSDVWKLPYFNPYIEGGLALFKDGRLISYQTNYENKRVIVDNGTEDVICNPSKFRLKLDTLYIERCGWTFIIKIEKLTRDTLELKEITKYGFYPDSIPIIFVRSKDQSTSPIEDYQDYSNGPVKANPIKK